MAGSVVSCISVSVLVFCFAVVPGMVSEDFPLNCWSGDEMDLLCLYFDHIEANTRQSQKALCDQTVQDLSGFPSNMTYRYLSSFPSNMTSRDLSGFTSNMTYRDLSSFPSNMTSRDRSSFPSNTTSPLVMSADVIDMFSAHNPSVNVSSWHFRPHPGSDVYGASEKHVRKQQYRNIKVACELKIQFVQHLFSGMSGVRENVSHIAVIFLNGAALSYEESRSVPRFVEQQETGIKVFFVVLDVQHQPDVLYLPGTLLIDTLTYLNEKHVLTMALCSQCMDGWFRGRTNITAYSVSCYTLLDFDGPLNALETQDKCRKQGSHLAAIETKHELNFLQSTIYLYFTEHLNLSQVSGDSYPYSVQIYIGLNRDNNSAAKRFHWKYSDLIPGRPLVINNWLRGKPSSGRGIDCAVWQFAWDGYRNDTGMLMVEDSFIEGWTDVGCKTKLMPPILCEMDIPRRIDNNTIIGILPATNESLSRTLTKGDFRIYQGNIVSVSANIASSEFHKLIRETGGEFPLFDCGVGEGQDRYISYVYVCDSIDHCSNKRDETLCSLEVNDVKGDELVYTHTCNGVYCCDGSCLPLQWVNDGEVDCNVCEYSSRSQVNDESVALITYLKRNESCAMFCNWGQCVLSSQLNDGTWDCAWPEGPVDETLGKLETAKSCYSVFGHEIWAPRCVYVRDYLDAVLGCRDMSHLKDCVDYKCTKGYFKCPETYCIPQHYVLDGQVDCPTGEDEQPDIIGSCTGNFACWNSKMCLHLDQVCDRHPDCPHGDDEVDCLVSCIEGFRCVSGTVTVSDYNRSIPLRDVYPIDRRIRFLDLSGVDLSVADLTSFGMVENVIVIIWSNCQIGNSIIDYFPVLWRVRELDLSYNLIQVLDGTFMGYIPLQNVRHLNLSYNTELTVVKYLQLTFLETLDLSHTGLADVDASFLEGLPNLKHLNLSSTFISNVQKIEFPSNLILQSLDLRRLYVDALCENLFHGLTINQHMYTDRFELCCPQIRGVNIPYYTCHAPTDAISSCFDLIGVNIQRVLLWVVAVLAVLGNITVIVYRIKWDRSVLTTGYGLLIINLSISDFIMGVYMFIIASADYYYRDTYVLHDKFWRESITCRLAAFLATLSSETSIFCISLITVDRFLVVKFPFGQVRFSKKSKITCLILSWITSFLLALTPIVFKFEIHSSNAMCIGLPLTTKRLYGWEYAFSVYIVLNLCQCLVIACGQRAIFRAISENRINETATGTSPRRLDDITVAKQLSLVALSNFLCWFPIGVMGLLSLAGHKISNDVYAWTSVMVIPINSAANPFLYTIPALLAKWKQFKSGDSTARSNSASKVTNRCSVREHK